jgi:hypothetical protein
MSKRGKNGARNQPIVARTGLHGATKWFSKRVKSNRDRDRAAKLARRKNRRK